MTPEKTFYITTPIYYVNDVPHLGHAYTTVAADTVARYRRLEGKKVFFLTGTDEHGQKVERAARQQGEAPQELADRVVERFKGLWQRLEISNDYFIRTTEAHHKGAVQHFFNQVYEKGDIYLGDYEDWYCTPCETFWTETQLVQGNCPDCGRSVEKLKEKSYFFRMSRYQEALLSFYAQNPHFVQPQARYNEIIRFVQGGLRDLSISRTSFRWGIPVPRDSQHVIYVWFDALANYISAAGYPEDPQQLESLWPANIHLIGKDILRFHAVYWPTFLMSAGLPLPHQIFSHGWWTVEGRKMSKSLQNVVDPNRLLDQYGVDPIRYYLLREVAFGLDGDFSHSTLIHRVNSDLANDLGNLLSRTLSMAHRYSQGQVPPGYPASGCPAAEVSEPLRAAAERALNEVRRSMEELAFHKALAGIWELVGAANKFIDEKAPWNLAKDPEQRDRLDGVLYSTLEALRQTATLLSPFLPGIARQMEEQLGIHPGDGERPTLGEATRWGGMKAGKALGKPEPLFPRLTAERIAEIRSSFRIED
ncbi:MAG: methionine--tRNA ligase [Candidatus Tectomicrobia bacterium]|uniref:Methionine--tRNA ligase n=1 Tax=Tectimicrobiota bacterium TaxID=2528274 RepID=A0A932GNG9_UNCTE|nr:methionine--tRNA ligase [Candidatus Tectomicrobia bacterium]